MINRPTPLKKGDTVAITCPAWKLPKDIDSAVKLFESWGLKVILGETINASYHQFAGDDNLRARDFQHFLDDNSVKAIFAARGGYGTVRIIDRLDFSKFKLQSKWIVGFSDITVLLSHIYANYQIETLHGPIPLTIPDDTSDALETLRKVLFNEPVTYRYVSSQANKYGEARGILVGGNLSILIALSNSVSEVDYRNKILFIEDVGEYLYAIDRMMWALKRSGKLSELKGLIVGSFSQLKDNNVPFGQTVEEIILDKVKDYSYPVCLNFPTGHIADNQALVVGRQTYLKVDVNQVTLAYE